MNFLVLFALNGHQISEFYALYMTMEVSVFLAYSAVCFTIQKIYCKFKYFSVLKLEIDCFISKKDHFNMRI